jgi:hypothetical protein
MVRRLLVSLPVMLVLAAVPAAAVGKKDDKAPDVTPARVSGVTPTSAVVTAGVNTRDSDATYAVEFGTSAAFGERTAEAPLPARDGNQDAPATLTGLAPGTMYVVRVVATNANGSTAGNAVTFTTPVVAPDAPAPKEPKPHGKDDQPNGKDAKPKGKGKGDDAPTGDDALTPAPDLISGPPATAADAALGKAVVVGAREGIVKVKVRGADGYSVLGPGAAVPVGSVVDATNGTVRLTTAVGDGTQDALLRGAKFEVRQTRAGRGMTDIVLRGGDFSACRREGATTAHAARSTRRPRKTRRSLWAKDDSGRFRTHGRHSVATVRGTEWRTTDTCRGTTTSVRRGAVLVRELRSGRRVLVRAGERHFARARR